MNLRWITHAGGASGSESVQTRALLVPDDVALHAAQGREQLALLLFRHFELVERRYEVAHQRAEFRIADAHPLVRSDHVAAGVGARSARGGADLIHQHLLQVRNIRIGEAAVDPAVASNVADEVVDHRRDGGFAAQPGIDAPGPPPFHVFARATPEHTRARAPYGGKI